LVKIANGIRGPRRGGIGIAIRVILTREVPAKDVVRIRRVDLEGTRVSRSIQRYAELHRLAGLRLNPPRPIGGRPEETQIPTFGARAEVLPTARPRGHGLARGESRGAGSSRYHADRHELLTAVEGEPILLGEPCAVRRRFVVLRETAIGLARD